MNVYAGIPDDIREQIETAATKALEIDIRRAIEMLTEGGYPRSGGEFEAVVRILQAMIGEDE